MLNLLSTSVFVSLLSIAMAAHTTVESSTSTSTAITSTTSGALAGKPILSTLWTEGLIMCLLVALLLIFVLVMAIQWTSSIGISYGALEKSNNPIKKQQ